MSFTFKLSKRLALTFAALGSFVWGCTADPSGTSSRRIAVDPPAAIGDTLFADGFESGSIAWDDNFRPQAKTVVSAAARTGTKGLRVTFTSTTNGGTLSRFIARGDRVYARVAVRFPATWTGATGLLAVRAAPATDPWASFGTSGWCPAGNTWAVTGAYTSPQALDLVFNTYFVGMRSFAAGQCAASAGFSGDVSTATYVPPLAVPKGGWHVVEVEAQMNTVGAADGWQKVWLDGTLRGEWRGLTFRTTSALQWNAVSLELPGFNVTQTQALDIDDILVLRQAPTALTAPAPVATVQVAPASATLNVGQTIALTATLRDAAGTIVTGRALSWSSSNAAVATVSGAGVVTALTAGSAAITATSEGRSGNATMTVAAAAPTGQVLLSEGFDDTRFSGRGWYDFAATPAVTTADRRSGAGALAIQWAAGGTAPPMRVMRKLFTATDRLYVSYWVKYSTNYVGSGRSYHPQEFVVLSNQDQDADGLSYNYLNTRIEQNYQSGGIPRIAIQDSRMIDAGRIGTNLSGVTENRSVAGCNGNTDGTGVTNCYQVTSSQWYNAKTWDAPAVAFRPTTGADYKGNWNRVEVELQLNSIVNGIGQANGVVRYWLNGNLRLERTNVLFRTGANPNLKFRQFLIAPYIGAGSPVAQTMWVDDLVLATSRDGSTVPPPPPPAPAPVATVSVTPATATVAVGATSQLSAVTRDAAGAVLTGRTITWTTSASGVATVVNGLVTGRGTGQATITATSEGRAGSAVITVPAPPMTPVASVTVTPATATTAVGATTQLSAVTRDAAGATLTGRTITWTTSAAGVATVVNGLVTGRGAGQATITATSEGRAGSAAITVTALPPPPATGPHPNEPAGAIRQHSWVMDLGAAVATSPETDAQPWFYIGGNAGSRCGACTTISDPTAPVNPTKVGRLTITPNNVSLPLYGNGITKMVSARKFIPPSSAKKVYWSYYFKFQPGWVQYATQLKHTEMFYGVGGIITATTNISEPFALEFYNWNGSTTQHVVGASIIRTGVWYHVEVIVDQQTWRHQMFVNGQPYIDRVMSVYGLSGMREFGFVWVYGGGGSPGLTQLNRNIMMDHDELYMSYVP